MRLKKASRLSALSPVRIPVTLCALQIIHVSSLWQTLAALQIKLCSQGYEALRSTTRKPQNSSKNFLKVRFVISSKAGYCFDSVFPQRLLQKTLCPQASRYRTGSSEHTPDKLTMKRHPSKAHRCPGEPPPPNLEHERGSRDVQP